MRWHPWLAVLVFVGGACVTRGQPFGDDCEGPGDCASGICAEAAGGGNFCTRSCADDCDCTDVGASVTFRCDATASVCVVGTGDCMTDCVPDCSGRSCGPDPVCGQPCGTCDDGDPCTVDRCARGRCATDPAPDGVVACTDAPADPQVTLCDRGSARVLACSAECAAEGLNVLFGCDGTLCSCDGVPGTCALGEAFCDTPVGLPPGVVRCESLAAGPTWRYRDCETECAGRGLRATGDCEGTTCGCF